MKKILTVVALACSVLLGTGCNKLKSRDQLNKGVQAFKNAKYNEAVEHFKTAVELDPSNQNARIYLATSYFVQYIPGAASPENDQMAKAATDEFMKALQHDPNDKNALASLASLDYQEAQGIASLDDKLKKLDEAKEWNLKLVQVDPNNKEAYYSLGVIDWLKWYPKWNEARVKVGMKPEDPGPLKDKKIKEELKTQYGSLISDGIEKLQKALSIDPNYADAMAYMNLLIRERADLQDTQEAYKQDVDTADNWVQKNLETRRIQAAKASKSVGGVTPDAAK